MATNYLVLGQVAPNATTATTLYTVPSSTQSIVSTVFVCNRDTASAAFRLSVRPDGAVQADEHYIAYDVRIDGNTIVPITTGITLGDEDVLTVYGSSGSLSFSAFGSEVSA